MLLLWSKVISAGRHHEMLHAPALFCSASLLCAKSNCLYSTHNLLNDIKCYNFRTNKSMVELILIDLAEVFISKLLFS